VNGSLKFNPLRLHTYILVRKHFGLVQSNLKASKRFFSRVVEWLECM